MTQDEINYLDQLVIDLHNQARGLKDTVLSQALRNKADLISEMIKKEKHALYGL